MKLYKPLAYMTFAVGLALGSAGCATTGCKYAPSHAMSKNPYSPNDPCYQSFEHQRGKQENIRDRARQDQKEDEFKF